MESVYEHPEYYDLAFSFRDFEHEVDVLEETIRRFSKIPVHRVLELACGNSPHLPELARRGYAYVGLDLSRSMIAYVQGKAGFPPGKAIFVESDMRFFHLEQPVDFAYVMLGSLYAASSAELASHFQSVAGALRPGGLYFLDGCVEFSPMTDFTESWEIERDGVHIRATCLFTHINCVEQTMMEKVILEVDEDGTERKLISETLRRAIYPQEWLLFLEARRDFEFIGWWNDWDLDQPLIGGELVNRPIVVIRRTDAA